MQPQLTEIMTFDAEYVYQIVLLGGLALEGNIIDARSDGIVLNNLQHIPTDKILYFVPLKKLEQYETPE